MSYPNTFSSVSNFTNSGRIRHTQEGTSYGARGVDAYAEHNHGPDGILFLDEYFKGDLENVQGQTILDAGCGAAPWAIYAALHGGQVCGIDIQEGMIKKAKETAKKYNVEERVTLDVGSVAELPYENNFFDKEISICVGCNLPKDIFKNHISECYRTTKDQGTFIVGAPYSLDVVFDDGTESPHTVSSHIQHVLNQLPNDPPDELIYENLMQMKEVLSATFYIKDHRLTLVTNAHEQLEEGQEIWRKLQKVVVPNRYYSRSYYEKLFRKYHWQIRQIDLPHFDDDEERITHNQNAPANSTLGASYVTHSPFIIFHLEKHSDSVQK
jgi:SAM-dependent methyltransferase